MGKKKTFEKQKRSLVSISKSKNKKSPINYKSKKMEKRLKDRNAKSLIPYSPSQELLDEKFIAQAVWECLKNNDPEGVVEIIEAHLHVVNKSRLARESDLPRSSLYNAIKGKNPTIKTLAKLVNCCK